MIKRLIILGFSLIYLLVNVQGAFAITSAQQNSIDNDALYYQPNLCSGGGSASATNTPGTGAPNGVQFPNLDPGQMASAVNTWITQQNPNSKLAGDGTTIVASAQHSNVSPFLIVAIADKETSLADPNSYNVKYANNPFSREATSSQPNYPGAGPNAGTLWYKWSSVEASVDYTAPENQNATGGGDIASYLRDNYATGLNANSLSTVLEPYAPPSQNNTALYIQQVQTWLNAMASLTTGSPVASSSGTSTTNSSCCNTTSTTTTLVGTGNMQQAYNFFVQQGLTGMQSAGIVGNFVQESNVNPTSTNSIGAHGIAQWLGGRLQNLVAFAQTQSPPTEDSLSTQLNFAWHELNGSYSSVLQELRSANDIPTATGYIFNNYEVAGDSSLPARVADAQQVYQQYGGSAATATTASASSSSTSSSAASGGCSSNTSSSAGYQNPFRDVTNLVSERIDQGVDFAGTGPVYAIGNGTVNGVYQNWYLNEPFIAYTLTSGAASGKTVYLAECVTPSVTAGESVTSTTVIATMTNCGNGIETGWANTSDLPDSMALNCWDHVSSTFGVNFSQLLQSLGGKAGVVQEANPPCTLPTGWPTW